MKALKMNDLLKNLINYDFYDWEDEDNNKYVLKIGMPNNLLSKINFHELYDSWGFEAIENEYASPSFSQKEWLKLEEEFFTWLEKAGPYLFPKGKVLVTPSLERNWLLYENSSPIWDETNEWIRQDYEKYYSNLLKAKIFEEPPSSKDDYRGAIIESYSEIKIVGKMAIKGVPLLFFSNENLVVHITEYLSLLIYFKNHNSLEQGKTKLMNLLNAQILED
ncbi:hypothetical protein [Bacillus sp. FJAT-52991]|uniref:Uncharacterized protein n=1 Tax=Bacillus kandeliae TaxID=3129297 RepID=A0ABZ2N300_9BACI